MLALEPYPLNSVRLSGSVLTVGQGKSARLTASRENREGIDELRASGSVGVASLPQRVYRSVSDADLYTGSVLQAFLKHAGVKVRGKVVVDRKPLGDRLTPIAAVDGFPLDWQLRGLMKMSNNFIADMLTIDLDVDPARKTGATLEGGAQHLSDFMRNVLSQSPYRSEVSQSDFVLESGSGLTPENKLSARDVVSVLERMYKNTKEFPSFLSALPAPGAEGTLKKRFSDPSESHLRDRIRAKTGTLSEPADAVALAGYSRLSSGGWAAFAIIVNGTDKRSSFGVDRLRDIIDSDLGKILPP